MKLIKCKGEKMSRTELYIIDEKGDVRFKDGFRNSYRGAVMIWSQLVEAHIFKTNKLRCSLIALPCFDDSGLGKYQFLLGDIAYDKNIPIEDRIILVGTFDHCIVKRENIPKYLDALEKYMIKYDCGNLDDQYKAIKQIYDDAKYKNIVGICWNQTSVSCGVWSAPWDKEKEEHIAKTHNIYQHKHYSLETKEYTKENYFLFDIITYEMNEDELNEYTQGKQKVYDFVQRSDVNKDNYFMKMENSF